MAFANAWWMFVILMGLRGFFLPLYRVAGDTMVADLITDDERRLPAYSLSRTVNNVGVAIGPVLGGFVAAYSYRASFLTAACTMGFFALLVALGMVETLPKRKPDAQAQAGLPGQPKPQRAGSFSYKVVLQDTLFALAIVAFTFNGMGAGLPFQLIGIYGKENYGIPENQTGMVILINALMVVLFQVPLANAVRRFNKLKVLATGALFYAAGVSSFTLGSSFSHFALSMAVLTVGELLIAPTFTSFAVNLAPDEMRGRYMSFYSIGFSFSRGLGPALAGRVYDNVSPHAVWTMGGGFNLIAAVLFTLLIPMFNRRMAKDSQLTLVPATQEALGHPGD
jgi:predicted MFS family arabinose efflux permease